jgi:MtN3 and saliva related transmembrane protein
VEWADNDLHDSMNTADKLGYLAAFLTTCSFVPQVWRTFRTRDVSGISLKMYSLFTLGVAVWLAYGLALREVPMILANSLTLVMACCVLAMKLRWGKTSAAGS